MASATISITACDNELYLLAIPAVSSPGSSYQLLHMQSGNSNSVNVTVTVSAGSYSEPAMLNGVNQPLNSSSDYTVSIPNGDYNLFAVGIDWGVGQQFAINLNGTTPYSLPLTSPNTGSPAVVWDQSTNPAVPPLPFSVS